MNTENAFWYSYDGEGNEHRTWMVGATSESDAYQRAHKAGMPMNISLRRLGHGFLGVITIHADSATLNREPAAK